MLPANILPLPTAQAKPDSPQLVPPVWARIGPARFRQWMANQISQLNGVTRTPLAATSMTDPSSSWYAGMVIDPTDFSQQLCRLQMSLQRAGASQEQAVPVGRATKAIPG